MGLFGKIFEKKECAVCGEEIKLFGNRKLEDGNLCKKCEAKLSPWFSERRSSTVDSIKEQLEYREENQQAVAAFNTTRTLGSRTKVLIDEDAGTFMVTDARNIAQANPDVLQFSQVTGCDLRIDEDARELYKEVRQPDGSTRNKSYSPRRYEYFYDFYITIHVNHPYFDEIKFPLNSTSVEVEYCDGDQAETVGMFIDAMMNNNGVRQTSRTPGSTTAPPVAIRMADADYAHYANMGNEIKEALTQIRTQAREQAAAAVAPKTKVTCPNCGAATFPDAAGCCEYCGSAIA